MHRVRQTAQQAEDEEQATDRISMPRAPRMVDAIRSDHGHVWQLMLKAGSLRGDGKQRTKLERLAGASALSEVDGARCACSLLWHYHNSVRNL